MPCCCDAHEPHTITAGDTLSWTRALSEYPASAGWTLHYAAASPTAAGAAITFAATTATDGQSYTVDVPASTTAGWTPGRYILALFVTGNGGQQFTVERRELTILAGPLAAEGTTSAQRCLTLIEQALEGRIPRGLEETTIDGQQLNRIPIQDLHALKRRYQAEVKAEQRAALAAAGVPVRKPIRGVRFVKPGTTYARGAYLFPLDS